MDGAHPSLADHVSGQLRALCAAIGLPAHAPLASVRPLIEPVAGRSLADPPAWPTDISDDHTPVEYSIACDAGKPPVLRILGETFAQQPGRAANLRAALRLVDRYGAGLGSALDRFHLVRQVFLDGDPQSDFALWFSLVHRAGRRPEVKIYFNPDTRGPERAPHLVAEALRRLGLDDAYATVLRHGVRTGEPGNRDRFSFFALDLHSRTDARTKVYLSHRDADADSLLRAASATPQPNPEAVLDFLKLTGCTEALTHRPAVSGYTFAGADTDRPGTYSLYLPIRDYVRDDEHARDLVLAVADRFGLDTGVIDRAIAAVARRPLHTGVGLIPHVSLRVPGDGPPGVTVYLSAEAYRVRATPRWVAVRSGRVA